MMTWLISEFPSAPANASDDIDLVHRTDIVAASNDVRPATAADLGLRRDQIHDARLIRDAEANDPGIVRRTLDDRLAQGAEPPRSALRKMVTAATMRGLRPQRSATFAALAGVILAGRLASGPPTLANELLLPSIAAVVVGGTAITGGVGSIWRTLIGALIISVVRIGMTFVGVNIFAQNILFGLVLVAAVAITIDRSKIPIVK
jgi:hypothetical protein